MSGSLSSDFLLGKLAIVILYSLQLSSIVIFLCFLTWNSSRPPQRVNFCSLPEAQLQRVSHEFIPEIIQTEDKLLQTGMQKFSDSFFFVLKAARFFFLICYGNFSFGGDNRKCDHKNLVVYINKVPGCYDYALHLVNQYSGKSNLKCHG